MRYKKGDILKRNLKQLDVWFDEPVQDGKYWLIIEIIRVYNYMGHRRYSCNMYWKGKYDCTREFYHSHINAHYILMNKNECILYGP